MHLCIGPRATTMPLDRKRVFAGGYLRLSMTAQNRPAQHSRTLPGSTPGGIGAGLATRQGCPIAAHAVGARGGQDQRANKPARSSYTNNPRSLPVHYGFGIPGVNAPGIPGVTCNAGAGGLGAGIGRPGISGASVGRSSGGIPSVARTGSLVNPLGFM